MIRYYFFLNKVSIFNKIMIHCLVNVSTVCNKMTNWQNDKNKMTNLLTYRYTFKWEIQHFAEDKMTIWLFIKKITVGLSHRFDKWYHVIQWRHDTRKLSISYCHPYRDRHKYRWYCYPKSNRVTIGSFRTSSEDSTHQVTTRKMFADETPSSGVQWCIDIWMAIGIYKENHHS